MDKVADNKSISVTLRLYKLGRAIEPIITSMATSETCETKIQKTTFRNFAITWNNYPADFEEKMKSVFDNDENIRYIVAGKEEAPDTGTPHLQITVHYWTPVRFSSVVKAFHGHVSVCFKSLGKNINYCKKDGDWFDWGEPPAQGRRTDLISCKRKLDAGVRVMELAKDDAYFGHVAKYSRFFDRYSSYIRDEQIVAAGYVPPECHIRLGPTGTGKSKWCDDTYGFCNYYDVALARDGRSIPWVNPDKAHKDVWVFNDVGPNNCFPSEWFRRLADGRPLECESKGGSFICRPKVIVITSNTAPRDWWPGLSELDYAAIRRRFTSETVVE